MPPVAAAICVALSRVAAKEGEPPSLRQSKPPLPTSATTAAGFVPPGWTLERSVQGDLNRDGKPDIAAVLKGADPNCIVHIDGISTPLDTNPRVLLVAFGQAGGYRLHLANKAVIPRLDDRYMDDPLNPEAFAIRGDVLRLGLAYWRSMGGWTTWTSTLSFRWDGERLRLIGFDKESLQRNSGQTEVVSANFLTGRARITTGSMEDDVESRTRWRRLPARVESLERIGDGLSFELDRGAD
jgi:hypothetical protein